MLNKMLEGMPAKINSDISDRILQDIPDKIQNIGQIEYQKIYQITKGSVSYLSSPCFSTIIGGIGGQPVQNVDFSTVCIRYQL